MKLTNDQIESIRAVSPDLAEKLEAGEKVTVEKAADKWEPNHDAIIAVRGSRITNACLALQAYREEFALWYVVPPVGEDAFFVFELRGVWHTASDVRARSPTVIYMPRDICEDLCRKLNSGEVVL